MSNSSRINRKFDRMFPNAIKPGDIIVNQTIQQTDYHEILTSFRSVIESRIKHFENISHTYEANELKQALGTVERLVPPSAFMDLTGNILRTQ